MKKYIIIDTWNGEGYSDSDAKIMEFENDEQALLYCKIQANIQAETFETEEYEIQSDVIERGIYGYGYCDEVDSGDESNYGAYYFEPYTEDIIGVILNPCINDYEIIRSVKDWDKAIVYALMNGDRDDLDSDEWGFFNNRTSNRVYIHSGGRNGDALFIDLQPKQEEDEQDKDAIIKTLVDRLNACHTAMDSATDMMKENGWDDTDAYLNLACELVENEELLKSIEEKTNINPSAQDFMVQELTLIRDRNESLKQALKDCRQAMLDTGRFNKDSLQIISIDLELNK